jgi:hypothetical protein
LVLAALETDPLIGAPEEMSVSIIKGSFVLGLFKEGRD